MAIYLVRHAKAGSRRDWDGPDTERPLTNGGWRQAVGLVHLLGAVAVPRLVSSPYVRCRQTLEPLAAHLRLPVELCGLLAEERAAGPVVDLLDAAADNTVLCSHGDVIPATIEALWRGGMALDSEPDWRKGSTWVLERGGDGRFARARALAPPPSRAGVTPG